MTPIARLSAYVAEHLTVDGRATAESSASPYGDLVNIVEMLPDVFAEVERLRAIEPDVMAANTRMYRAESRATAAESTAARLRAELERVRRPFAPGDHVEWCADERFARDSVHEVWETCTVEAIAADEVTLRLSSGLVGIYSIGDVRRPRVSTPDPAEPGKET